MNYCLFFHDIEDESCGLSRAERESKAVGNLVAAAFGQKAEKSNLPSGAPLITVEGKPVEKNYSISHCKGLAVLAVAEGVKAIGTDIEIFRPQLRRVIAKFLTEEEAAVYSGDEALLAAWTLKEAAYKAALTTGLNLKDILLPLSADTNIINIPGAELTILENRALNDAVHIAVVAQL